MITHLVTNRAKTTSGANVFRLYRGDEGIYARCNLLRTRSRLEKRRCKGDVYPRIPTSNGIPSVESRMGLRLFLLLDR